MKSLLEMEKEEVVSFLNSALEKCGSRNIRFDVVDAFIVMSAKFNDRWSGIFYKNWTTVSEFLVGKYSSNQTLFTVSRTILGLDKQPYSFGPRDFDFLRTISSCENIDELRIRLDLIA